MSELDKMIECARVEYRDAYARYLDLVKIKTIVEIGGKYEIPTNKNDDSKNTTQSET